MGLNCMYVSHVDDVNHFPKVHIAKPHLAHPLCSKIKVDNLNEIFVLP